jgi:hypothetical protein
MTPNPESEPDDIEHADNAPDYFVNEPGRKASLVSVGPGMTEAEAIACTTPDADAQTDPLPALTAETVEAMTAAEATKPKAAKSGAPVAIDKDAARKILDADFKNILKKVKRGQPLTETERRLVKERQTEAGEGPRVVDSLKQAAAVTGKPSAVLRAMKRAGCPAFLPGSRVDVALLRELWDEWEAKLKEGAVEGGGLDEAIKAEKLRKLKLENAALDGTYIDRARLAERLHELCARANAILQTRLIVELPPLVAGLDAAAIRAECEKIHARICSDFKKFAEEWE